MAQKTGALIFDEQTDRYDIRFDIADYYGGLHCGDLRFFGCIFCRRINFLNLLCFGLKQTHEV